MKILILILLFSGIAFAESTNLEAGGSCSLTNLELVEEGSSGSNSEGQCVSSTASLKKALTRNTDKCSRVHTKTIVSPNGGPFRVVTVEIYCQPRKFSDLALINLFKSCVTTPIESCFEPKLIDRLDKIQITTFTEQNIGSCKL